MKEDMHEKTNCCTIQNDKLERKQYIKKCKGYTTKDVTKIRLNMYNTQCNYKRNESDKTCPLCTTEHIMVCQEVSNKYILLDENEKVCKKIVAILK